MTPQYTTRIAPSPTGPMHLGTARTAYFNHLAAKASGGKFILRIDDTDNERSEFRWVEDIVSCMAWLGLDFDALVFQSESKHIYQQRADYLFDMGFAITTGKGAHMQLALRELPDASPWVDRIAGPQRIAPENVSGFENMTIIKPDGTPTYHFATVVDDIDMGVNLVIRGVDHLTNTAKHALLCRLLGEPMPEHAHVGLLFHKGKKLSKRNVGEDAPVTVKDCIDLGFCREAVLNLLGRCGWGPSADDKTTALLPVERMTELFLDGGKMRSAPSNVDFVKLASYDRKYKARMKAPSV